MKKSTKIITGILYLISISLIISGVLSDEISISKLSIGATLLIIPWLICIKNAFTLKDQQLWAYFIIFFGLLAMPIYLFSVKEQT